MAAKLIFNLSRRRPLSAAFSSATIPSTSPPKPQTTDHNLKWLALPPFAPPVDASSLGKQLSGRDSDEKNDGLTALKWVRRCCPHLPMALVQKLFRLRQVRKDARRMDGCGDDSSAGLSQLKRIAAKDVLMTGEVVLLPSTLRSVPTKKCDSSMAEFDVDFVRGLELYKDEAIIVVNKPPGIPVQGGVGIKYSMDILAASCLKYDYPEPPRLVHRLDRDCGGILLLGRTLDSASILHSLFREKTSGAVTDETNGTHQVLQRKYLALVIGTPKHSKGLISAPLTKIIVGDRKSERITIANNSKYASQHALTEYKVITSAHGYTWLELRPLTGRKHQLRVHCAEALGTPIVGDFKYGRFAHKDWTPMPLVESMTTHKYSSREKLPFGLKLEIGSISDKSPHLHLHCKQMILPSISVALEKHLLSADDHDFSKLEKLNFVAPMPPFMQISWDILSR